MRALIRRMGVPALIVAVLMWTAACQPVRAPRPDPVAAPPEPAQAPTAVPAGKLKIFRDAVHILYQKSVETFLRIEELEGKYAVMATDIGATLTLDAFKPVLDGRQLQTLTDLRFREAAADVLNQYAALLYAVSAGETATDVDRAAEELSGSLAIFENATRPEGIGRAEAAGIFHGVSAGLNDIRREPVRATALQTLMNSAQVDVQRLCAIVVRDHGQLNHLVDQMIRGIVASADKRRPVHEDYIDPDLAAYDSRIAALIKESREIQAALDAVMAGFALAPEAHFAIRNVLGRPLEGLPPLQQLWRKAREAERRYRVLESDVIRLP